MTSSTAAADFAEQERLILDADQKLVADGAELVLTPELAVTGYPDERIREPGYATLLRTIVGQQVSVAAAASIWRKLETAVGAGMAPDALLAVSDEALRAAGLSRGRVLMVYAFRNALLPVVTTLGMVFSFTLGANVLVEKVFAWPGIGSFAIEALVVSDYAAVQGFVLSMAVLFVVLNLVIDTLYTLIDPRVQVDG